MRPDFIPQEQFRAYLSGNELNKCARVGGIFVTSYVARCEREGRPLPHKMRHGCKRWRLLDVVARARADCLPVEPPTEVAVSRDIATLVAERDALKAEIATKKHALAIQAASLKLTGATLLDEAEIAAARLPLPNRCGVYFLLRGASVVYVGQSVKVFSRVLEHMATKDFDGFAYVPCDPKALDALESLYIHSLRPELNGKWQNGPGMHAPLRLDKILAA